MFHPERSEQEIWGIKIFRFPRSLCRDPEKCLYISKDFSGTDIYHSDIKNALVLRYCKLKFFFLFSEFQVKIVLFILIIRTHTCYTFLKRTCCSSFF